MWISKEEYASLFTRLDALERFERETDAIFDQILDTTSVPVMEVERTIFFSTRPTGRAVIQKTYTLKPECLPAGVKVAAPKNAKTTKGKPTKKATKKATKK